MSSTVVSAGLNREGFEEMVMTRCEPSWLTDLRCGAWKIFEETPLPDLKAENWRRTDLRLFRFDRFRFAGTPALGHPEPLPEALLAQGVELAGHVSSCDGRAVAWRLQERYTSQGAIFEPLDLAAVRRESLVRPYLDNRIVDSNSD